MRIVLLTTAIALSLIAATPPKFAAASIHRQAPDDTSSFMKPPANGKFIATVSSRFKVEANGDGGQPHNQTETREMRQNLLADRCDSGLISQKAPIDTAVIDSISQPSVN